MPNTLGTLSGTLVIQELLETLLVKFPILTQIFTNFTDKGALYGQKINTRVIVPTVAVDFVAATGYAATAQTSLDVDVTQDHHVHATYEVTDLEQSQTNRNLRAEFLRVQAHALGYKMVNDIIGVIKAATYPLQYPVSAANFSRSHILQVRKALNKALVPETARFMVLNADYAAPILDDLTIVGNIYNPGSSSVRPGLPPDIHGFAPSEYASMSDNGEALQGFAGNKESVIMTTSIPVIPGEGEVPIPGIIQMVTEPNSGFTVQRRRYYDMKLGKLVESLVAMYGFSAGLSEAGLSKRLIRIIAP